ncbi:MAG: helix-turn-helix domain-containing protein [Paracoccus sp. (in: a-proteobacteria)]|uniref:AraC-like ligand-binding domain-containing protein n=1 Tax=Paracoccus sp. TaxID=267 RepID=UPI0026DF8767|nr:helix-turn-helix domain-containing protein [Paracoccus sp. (in: a-proteobacteria)]MDO5630201.1 helix-turn-helix domain-containing protein [Paracoccus sp. (in: a-proteobacteria)]
MDITAHSTAEMPPEGRAAEWTRVIAETYFPLHLTFAQSDTFTGRLDRRVMGQVSLSRLATAPLQYERQGQHIAHIQDEEYLVTVPHLAPVDFKQLGREVRVAPGGFLIERADEPYRFSYKDPNDLSVLKISRRALAEKLRDPDRFCASAIDASSGLPALFTSMLVQLQSLHLNQGHAAAILGRQIVDVLALALDERAEQDDAAMSPVRAGHLRRAERTVRQNLANPLLSPGFVADICGISKRYLHELFGDTDRTAAQFIREERLIAARDMIASTRGIALAEIAYRFGFSDQAQFSRLFKAQFGMTPSEWRRLGASAA